MALSKEIRDILIIATIFVVYLVYEYYVRVYINNPIITDIHLNKHSTLTHQTQVKSVTIPETKAEIYPFMAFLHSNKSNCVGTLIDTRFILTAAHCVYGASSVHILLGTNDLSHEEPSKVILDSEKFIIHEDYTENGYDNDIALIHLDSNLETNNFINIISLSYYQVDCTQNNLFVLGWSLNANEGLSSKLEVKSVTAVDSNQCNKFYQKEDSKYDEFKIICTKAEEGPCHGDSGGPEGGPLISNNKQIAVLSRGMEDSTANNPIRYMNIGYYLNWIQNKISDTHLETETKSEIYPFMAFLYSNKRNCGGTLIDTRFILTAAHCVYGAPGVYILLGTKSLSGEGPSRAKLYSEKLIIHENYAENGYDNDIALIQLDSNLETNNFINITSLSYYYQVDCTQNNLFVLGWGLNATEGLSSELLVKPVTAVDSNLCNNFYQKEDFKYEKFKIICTVDEKGPCHGDSGGPLIMNNKQIGVLSGGMENCTANNPVRYMNVGYYLNWIQNKISDTDLDEDNNKFSSF